MQKDPQETGGGYVCMFIRISLGQFASILLLLPWNGPFDASRLPKLRGARQKECTNST